MFITFDRGETKWHKISNTYGVSRLVSFNRNLKPISNIFIDNLKMRFDSSCKLLQPKSLKNDDQVEISKGPFANFIVTIETYETDRRIWILLALLVREVKIQVTTDDLQLSS